MNRSPDDVEQLKLDLEDAQLRIDRIARSLHAVEDLERRIVELTAELRAAKRRLNAARWDLASATQPIRRLNAEKKP